MSWFDSSFSFAKTALSQAQKSIDKVLDIKESHDASNAAPNSAVVTTAASVSPPANTASDAVASTKTHGTPDPPSVKSSPLSAWLSPSQSADRSKQSTSASDDKSTPEAEKSSSSAFGSTWGGGDSFWRSYLGTPSTSNQGGREGGAREKKTGSDSAQEAPKPTSMHRGAGSKRMKSSASPAVKSESSDKRKTVASPSINSPPKSSSTPLAQVRAKSGTTTDRSSTPASSKPTVKPSEHLTTPKTSLKSQPPKKASLRADRDSAERSTSEGSTKVKSEKLSDRGSISRPMPTLVTKDTGVETTDGGSTGTGKQGSAVPKVEQETLPQQQLTEPSRDANTESESPETREHSKTDSDNGKLTNERLHGFQSSPTPQNTTTMDSEPQTQTSASSKGETTTGQTHSHSSPLTRESTQSESTETKAEQVMPKQDKEDYRQTTSATTQKVLRNAELETPSTHTGSSSEAKSNQQEKQVVHTSDTSELPELRHRESKEEDVDQSAKVKDEKDVTLPQIQGPTTDTIADEQQTSAPGAPASVVPEAAEKEEHISIKMAELEEGGRQPADSERKVEAVSSKEEQSEDHSNSHVGKLKKELADVRQLLEAREQKMVSMSREAISLTEANQTLQEELAEAKRMGQTGVEDLRLEFTRRLATAEKKLQAVVKERDSLRKQLQALLDEQTQQKQSVGDELTRLVKEKDEQIAQLMEEGEKLSKQELQSNGVIKKLRQKDKQNDQLLAAQRQQIDDLEGKVKILKEQLKKKEENESKYQESLGQLNAIAEQQAKELASLKSERDELMDKVRSLQTNLDNSYKELAELQKANAVTQNAAQEAALTAEQSAREELKNVLEQHKVGAQREKEALLMQVDELRVSVSRAEQQAAWREDHMRQELADMQQRLQEAETRNQELTSSISQATKPLLRQIENLQAAHSAQSANWDKIEANITQRLVQTQAQLSQSTEKERSAVEKEMSLQSRVKTLETQLSGTKQEKSQLLATLELERAKLQTLEESQQRDSAKSEALRTSYQQSMEELRKEKEMLERQLEYERVRLEAESRKACLESQEKERLRAQLASSLSLNRTVSRQSSSGSQSDILEKSLHSSEVVGSVSDMSPHGSRGAAPSASLIEQLQSLLKQKEGELSNAQNLVGSLERSRAAMAEDLANISAEYETLKKEVKTIPHLQQKLQEVERKHEAMLQMYGEKAEEAEELKLDIEDLKTMYRQQIEELLTKGR